MKKFNWIMVLLLGYVTCSIYTIYAWFQTAADHNTLAKKYGQKELMNFFVAFLIGMVTCGIYLYVWMFLYSKQMADLAKAKGVKLIISDEPIVLFLCWFIPFFGFYVWIENHNLLVDGE